MITGVRFGGTVIYEAATLDEAQQHAVQIRRGNRYALVSQPRLTSFHKGRNVSVYGHLLKAITGNDARRLLHQLGVKIGGRDTPDQIDAKVQEALARHHGSHELEEAKNRLVDAAVALNQALGKPITYHKINTTI